MRIIIFFSADYSVHTKRSFSRISLNPKIPEGYAHVYTYFLNIIHSSFLFDNIATTTQEVRPFSDKPINHLRTIFVENLIFEIKLCFSRWFIHKKCQKHFTNRKKNDECLETFAHVNFELHPFASSVFNIRWKWFTYF